MRESEIRGLPAVTRSGDRLGTVTDLIIDVDTHVVVQYVVARSRLLPGLSASELLVSRGQVVSVDRERLVTDDGVIAEAAAAKLVQAEGAVGTGGPSLMEG